MNVEKGQILIDKKFDAEEKGGFKLMYGLMIVSIVAVGFVTKSVEFVIFLCFFLFYDILASLWYNKSFVIMDRKGCYVKSGWRKRFYRWEEIRVKRIEQYWRATGGTNPDDYLVLSVHRLYKPKWMYIENYTHFICPFAISVFWVDLRWDYVETEEKSGRIDRDEFLDTLKEWGVELEDRRLKKWYRYR